MKKIIGLLLLTVVLCARAEPEVPDMTVTPLQRTVQCAATKTVFEYLINGEYKEVPYWTGNDAFTESKYVLLVNTKTKTWTMVQFDDKKACVIGTGENHTPIFYGPKV